MTDAALDEDRTASDFDDDFEPFDIEGAPELPAERYLDRELSWLAFNQRVLELAEDPRLPVLERANFLAIADDARAKIELVSSAPSGRFE